MDNIIKPKKDVDVENVQLTLITILTLNIAVQGGRDIAVTADRDKLMLIVFAA
jgi:hypothetical protein